MKDMFGTTINQKDIVAYANDAGWISLGVVNKINEKTLDVRKRGYRGEITKELLRVTDVIVVTGQVMSIDKWQDCGHPLEVEYAVKLFNEE